VFDFKKIVKQMALTLIICVPLSIILKKHFLFVFFVVEAVVLTNYYFFKAKNNNQQIKDLNKGEVIDVQPTSTTKKNN